ncbi:MAG: hypothetical protein NWT00_03270 [Beijerinckiaceae bacterium]|nr:hypothetical protein [Beijerinckiaceae bacterium]
MEKGKIANEQEVAMLRDIADKIEKGNDEVEGYIISVRYKNMNMTLKTGNTYGLKTSIKNT